MGMSTNLKNAPKRKLMRKIVNPIISRFLFSRNGVINAPAMVPLCAKSTKAWLDPGEAYVTMKPIISEHR